MYYISVKRGLKVLISTGECEYYRVSHKIVDTWVIAILSGKTHPVLKYSGNMLEVKYIAIYDELLDHVMWSSKS